MANYNQQKDRLQKLQERRTKEIELIEAKIDAERKNVVDLEQEKAKAIYAGDQNEFLTIADELRKSKDSLEYYCERKKKAAELFKIKPEELFEIVNDTQQEQKRLNTDAIKWLQEQIKGIYYVLEEIKKELDEGDKLNNEALNLYLKDAPPAEARATEKSLAAYRPRSQRFNFYRNNGVLEQFTYSLQKQLDYFEGDDLKEYFEEVYTEAIS